MVVSMEITLSSGLVATVDAADYPALAAHAWHAMRNLSGQFYVFRQEQRTFDGVRNRRTIYMHREILGVTDRRVEVDHINGCTLDNRRENLRTCSRSDNQHNYHRRKTGLSSRYKGVYWDKTRKQWAAHIKVNRKVVHLGRFADEVSAAQAYNAAALRLYGAFACPNDLEEAGVAGGKLCTQRGASTTSHPRFKA